MSKRINRYSAGSNLLLPNGLFVAVAACIAWWLFKSIQSPLVVYAPLADYWHYAAVVQEWLRDFASPANPHVADTALSTGFSPYLAIVTLLGSALGLDAAAALSAGAVFNFVLLVVGLKLFTQSYFRNPWAPAISLIVVFFFWGVGWNQHNLNQLGSFLHTASYPSTFAFALSLLGFRLSQQMLGNASLAPVWSLLLLAVIAIIFLTDPAVALFAVTGCILIALTEPASSPINQWLAVATVILGLAVAELWPYFSPWKAVLGLYQGSVGVGGLEAWFAPVDRLTSGAWQSPFYDPTLVIVTLGPILLGLPLVAWLFMRRQHNFIVYGALLMLVPYLLNILLPMPQAERFLLFAAFYLQLAIVWAWLALINAWSEIPRPAVATPAVLLSAIAGAGIVYMNVWMAGLDFDGRRVAPASLSIEDVRSLPDQQSVMSLYSQLLAPVPEGAVVLSSADDGLAVPLAGARTVSVRYDNPLLADQVARYQDTGAFLFRPLDELERVAIIQKYGVSHVLLNRSVGKVAEYSEPWVASYGQLVAAQGSYRVYELSPALHDVKLPEADSDIDQEVADTQPAEPALSADTVIPAGAGLDDSRVAVSEGEGVVEEATDDAPRSFGAPIAAPVLDPSRHGG